MALPNSGSISLADIQTEFGGSNPIGLNEYYRNGSYVTPNNTNIPTSGLIDFNDFMVLKLLHLLLHLEEVYPHKVIIRFTLLLQAEQ